MLRWFEYSQIYHPTRDWETAPADLGRPFEDITITAADGVRLSAWFFPADESSPRRHMAMVICHGNGGNISHRLPLCRSFLGIGINVLVLDYRGYGHSEGTPTEEGTYLDAQAAHGWLRAKGFSQIIAFGESLGGGIACELALRETVAGLILSNTFTNLEDMGRLMFFGLSVRWFQTVNYDTLSKLPRIHVPVIITHSRGDEVVPFRFSERNFAAANEPKLFCETQGPHNETLSLDTTHFLPAVEKFLALVESSLALK